MGYSDQHQLSVSSLPQHLIYAEFKNIIFSCKFYTSHNTAKKMKLKNP